MNALEYIVSQEVLGGLVFELLDVGTGTECLLNFAEKCDCPDLGISLILIDGVDDLPLHGSRQGIQIRLGVEIDDTHPPECFLNNLFVSLAGKAVKDPPEQHNNTKWAITAGTYQ